MTKGPPGPTCPGACQVNRPRATKARAQNGSGPLVPFRDERCGLLAHFFTLFILVKATVTRRPVRSLYHGGRELVNRAGPCPLLLPVEPGQPGHHLEQSLDLFRGVVAQLLIELGVVGGHAPLVLFHQLLPRRRGPQGHRLATDYSRIMLVHK